MSNDRREPLRVLVFSASLRADSLSTRLANLAATAIERLGASVDIPDELFFEIDGGSPSPSHP